MNKEQKLFDNIYKIIKTKMKLKIIKLLELMKL